MGELVALVNARLGRTAGIKVHVPYGLGYAGGLLADVAANLLKREFPISAVRVKKFCATTQFSSSRMCYPGLHDRP